MNEISDFVEKQLDIATIKVMQGDIMVPKHLAVRCAMEAAHLATEKRRAIDASFVDIYSRLVVQFLDGLPDVEFETAFAEACRRAQCVITNATDFTRELHGEDTSS